MKHLAALFIVGSFFLVGCLAVYFAHEVATLRAAEDGAVWRCTTLTCTAYLDVPLWVTDHCTTGAEPVCAITINGQSQTVPLASLNVTYLASQCVQWLCTEETLVRPMNYTLSINATSFSVQ